MGATYKAMLSCWLFTLLIFANTLAGENVAEPLILDDTAVSAYVAIPDINKLGKAIETVAESFAPGTLPAGALKAQLGAMLGDPTLANLDLTRPLAVMVMQVPAEKANGQPPVALFIPAKAAAPFDETFKHMGMVSDFQDGLLLVAKDDDTLTKAKGLKAAYQKLVTAGVKSDLRIYANVAGLMNTYGPALKAIMDMGIKQFANINQAPGNKMDPAMIMKVATLETKGLLAFLNQTGGVQYDLSLKPDSLNVQMLYAAKADSAIAALLSAPAGNKALDAFTSPGMISGIFHFNPQGYDAFINKLLPELAKDPDLAAFSSEQLVAYLKQSAGLFAGDMAMSVSADKNGAVTNAVAMSITDEKKYLALLENAKALMEPDSPLGKLFAGTGMKLSIEILKSVRQHGAIAVNKMKMTMDSENLPAAQREQIKNMVKDMEFAFVNGLYVGASNPEALDKLIDSVLGGNAAQPEVMLGSMKEFGKGKALYLDYDFIAAAKAMMPKGPNAGAENPAAALFDHVNGSVPMLFAADYANGHLSGEAKIPFAPFIEMAKAVKEMGPQTPVKKVPDGF